MILSPKLDPADGVSRTDHRAEPELDDSPDESRTGSRLGPPA